MPQKRNAELHKLQLYELQKWREEGWGGLYTLSSSGDVVGPAASGLFLLRDTTNGELALVLYHIADTPVIVSQTGSEFVTGSPGASQIQVKDLTTSIGFRAGSGRNGAKLRVTTVYA